MTFSYVLHLAEVPLFAKTLNRIDLQFSIMKPINQLHNSMHFLVLFNLNFGGAFLCKILQFHVITKFQHQYYVSFC